MIPAQSYSQGTDTWFPADPEAALVAGIAWLVISIRRTAAAPSGVMPIAPGARDDALARLRMRYARGEVSRDEFLQASADLTGTQPPIPHPPRNDRPTTGPRLRSRAVVCPTAGAQPALG